MSIFGYIKGALGELQGRAASKFFLDEKVYRSLHNVTIPAKGGTTQIDHVIVLRYGVFVLEAPQASRRQIRVRSAGRANQVTPTLL